VGAAPDRSLLLALPAGGCGCEGVARERCSNAKDAWASRWLAKEARRINVELHPDEPIDERASARKLERDPQTGVYRPK